MKRLTLLGAATAAALLLAPFGALAGGSATYTDALGDTDGEGPDIATLAISHDDAGHVHAVVKPPTGPSLAASEQVALCLANGTKTWLLYSFASGRSQVCQSAGGTCPPAAL